jgi:molybdopterin molybdotransferase
VGIGLLLSILTAADGYLVVPESATGLAAGSEVEVILYR